jgi:acetyltransferase-like isoleucine patch superfamily enzyme
MRKTKPWAFFAAMAYYLYNHFITRIPVYAIRHAYLRSVLGFRIGEGASVHMGCFVTGRAIRIGSHTIINRGCYLDGRASLVIGDNVSVSPECYLVSLGHDPHAPDFAAVPGPVVIGDYSWLGARAMVLPGVELGEGVAVGAGAVVTRSQPAYAIVAGVPAKRIGERKRGLAYRLSYFPFFDTDITG